MPEKEGAEEKTTKSVVNKKQKQMMGEEGYDHLRDMGRIRKNKKKKDATSYPPSDEVKKTQKKNKGPSALERVKKKYEGQIMDVKKEELDLTKVAEAFGGFVVESKAKITKVGGKTVIGPTRGAAGRESKILKKFLKSTKDNKSVGKGNVPFETGTYTKLDGRRFNNPQVYKRASQDIPDDILKQMRDTKDSSGARYSDPGSARKNYTGSFRPKVTTTGGKTAALPAADPADIKRFKTVKQATRKAQKKLIKPLAKTAAKKGIAKAGAKFAAKRIPGVGAVISGAEAIGRAAKGDFVGAALAAGEGITSSIPGVGTVASTALGGVSAARDVRRATKAASTVRSVLKKTKGAKGAVAVKKAFKGSPKKIGGKTSRIGKAAAGVRDYFFKPRSLTGNKKADLFLGRTRAGTLTRVGATQDKVKNVLGGALKKAGGGSGVVGRRSAGGFTAS